MQFKKYYQAVNYLESLAATAHDQSYMAKHRQNPQQYLDRTRELMRLLGNPHRGFRFIHITGTSGKGTTATYLHNILRQSGCRVGTFTSPYATTSIEKIRCNNRLIGPLEFARLLEKIKPEIERMEKTYRYGRPSYFEIFFALAIQYFKKMRCDWIILEVGCGGAYDAGNIIPKSISAITNVGLDHTQLLGNTLTKIAREKAGIIKPRTHFFTTEKRARLLSLCKGVCRKKHTAFHHIQAKPFQEANAALARAIAQHLGVKDDIIQKGISQTKLPCRFEMIQTNPLVILDGAHNPDKIKSVVHNLKHLTYKKLYTIFASSSTKNARAMIAQLARVSHDITFTGFEAAGRTAYPAKKLQSYAPKNIPTGANDNPEKALRQVMRKIAQHDALLITGSFYLAGKLRKRWISEQAILHTRTTHPTN